MLFAIIGHSASGKSTIESKLEQFYELPRVISYTTRQAREKDGETDGVHYHFISESKFFQMLGKDEFTEYAQYREWWYGLSLNGVDYKNKNYVVVVTPKGYYELLEKIGEEYLRTIFIKVDERDRLVRLANRGDDVDEIIRRIHTDRDDFDGFEKEAHFVIENFDIDKSVEMAYTIIKCLNK